MAREIWKPRDHDTVSGGMYVVDSANARVNCDGSGIEVYSNLSGPSFTINTIHISCSSDAYRGPGHKYGGIILYGCDGKSEWYTTNGTHCKTGYLVIQDTDCCTAPQHKYPNEPGEVHGAIYRDVFGESCVGRNVVGEGFGVENGEFTYISGVFNAANDEYRDCDRSMSLRIKRCLEQVVRIWKDAGSRFTDCQNHDVEMLLCIK